MAEEYKRFYVSTQANLIKVKEYFERNTGRPIALDFEHSNLDPHTGLPWLCALRLSGHGHVYVVDAMRTDLSIMKEVLEAAEIEGAGLKNDLKWLRKFWGIRPRRVYDCIINERILSAGISSNGNDLENLCLKYAGIQLDKSVRNTFIYDDHQIKWMRQDLDNRLPVWTQAQIDYAAEDVEYLHIIRAHQEVKAKSVGLCATSHVENRLVPVVADMEFTGILVDKDQWIALAEVAEAKRAELYAKTCNLLATQWTRQSMFPELTGSSYDINLNSDPEVIKAFAALGFDLTETNEKVLKKIPHPAAAALIDYRSADTQVTRYGRNWIALMNPETGRIHSSFNQVEARSGRYSSTGPNVQNVPGNEYRYAFIPGIGWVLIIADYSQIELRILAEASDDDNMITIFNSGYDLHSMTASRMLGIPIDQITSDHRRVGKTLNFAQIYGQGTDALAKSLGIPIAEAREYQDAYFGQFPKVQKYLSYMAGKPFATGYAETLLGRKRWFPNFGDGKNIPNDLAYVMRSVGKNHPIQGTSADMTKMAQIIMADSFLKYGLPADQINVVHDETVTQAPQEYAEEVADLVEKCMVRAGQFFLKKVPVVVDVHIDNKWSKG